MTFKKIINWVIGLPIAIIGVGFAVANRQWITLSFDPFNRAHPFATIDMPLWALFFCGVFFGIFAGWLVAWINNGKYRRATRQAKIELVRAQRIHKQEKRELQSTTALATRQDAAL
jgi:fructose-specific phosphotransferase system IIC component